MADRKLEILEATCRVIARQGADGLRMGTVAREAGVSSALIHYYFDTRADLLMQAFEHADRKADELALDAMDGIPKAVDRLERLLLLYGATNRELHEDWVLWVEMWRSAIFDDRLAESVRKSAESWIGQIAGLIDESCTEGSVGRDVDARETAIRLAALVDGLGLQLLSGVIAEELAASLIRDALALELGIRNRTGSTA
jgi:AcrR family transcriptional regulator